MIPPSSPPRVRNQIQATDILAAGLLVLVVVLAVLNIRHNLLAAGASPGFRFLFQEAGFDVSEALIPYSPGDDYWRVILVGVLNTLLLAVVCIILSTITGIGFGLLSVGPSPVGRGFALAYVDLFRNLPKLLILLVIYTVAVNWLPHVRDALSLGPFHLSNRALNFPVLVGSGDVWLLPAAFVAGLCGAHFFRRFLDGEGYTGAPDLKHLLWLLPVITTGLAATLADFELGLSVPELAGFDFQGGGRVSLQFAIVAVTLSIYHGAQIAEVIRGGLQSVPKGQGEAAKALGLTASQTIRLVILPQVFRIVVPPMNNQYVNLIKNTSIAIAVGYSDLMSVSGTIINQSFKPLEMMLITMAIYLGICLFVTTSLNRWHSHLTSRETR
ncbi:ABC transporter permease subunit [Roseibium sp.]|uniref:ABC transporter permease subunit n=1 Tax=Roseibium sp. TaxID=1936156 RepID=UPI003B509BCD